MSEESLEPTNGHPRLMPHEMREFDEREGQERVAEDGQRTREDKILSNQHSQCAGTHGSTDEDDEIVHQRPVLAHTWNKIWMQVAPRSKRGRTYGDLIVLQSFTMAARGDLRAIIQVLNRIGGTPLPALPEKEPPPPKSKLDLSRLSLDELKSIDKLFAKAKHWQKNDQQFVAATQAAKAFVQEPTAERLKALQNAADTLMSATK